MMATRLSLDSREQELRFSLMEALTSSLDLTEVFARAHGILSQLLPADSLALCVSMPGQSTQYDWMAADMPTEFFAHYPEMITEDFVRRAVVLHPNRVLRDTEMTSREALEHSLLYQRCRELGMPLERVMAVMLDVDEDWHGGLTLYRERPEPFSERDQALLQQLTPSLARSVRRCRMFHETTARGQILDALFHYRGAECVVLGSFSTEKMRTAHATELLEKWFAPFERGPSGLPQELIERLSFLMSKEGDAAWGLDTWERSGENLNLKVTFIQLPQLEGQRLWALVFQEIPHAIPLPRDWRLRLTRRQSEIVECVLKGWDNPLIAEHCHIKLATVKKHLQNIFDRLGADRRVALMCRAARS